jgi:hypothetical protein
MDAVRRGMELQRLLPRQKQALPRIGFCDERAQERRGDEADEMGVRFGMWQL